MQGLEDLYGLECIDSTSIAQIGWRDFFTDPMLQSLIEKGLSDNPDIRTAAQRVIEAEAALSTARLALFPSVAISSSASLANENNGYSIAPSASWEIDLRGSLLNSRRKAAANLEQSEIWHRSVETEIVASIAKAYYTLQMLDKKLAISRQTADSWKENVRIMKAMKEAGMTNEASVSQTEANAFSIEASLYDLKYQINQIENSLCLLIGQTPQSINRSEFSLAAIGENLLYGVPSQLLAHRPDVQWAELELRKAFYDTNIARASFYPSVKLNGSLGWSSSVDVLTSLIAEASETVFNAGRVRAGVKTAQAKQEEALIAFKNALLTAGNEVNDAIAKCEAARGKADLRIQQIDDLQSAVRRTQELMHNSGATYLEVLTAQQSLLSAQLLQVSDRYDEIDGLISLYRALGGGAE